MNDPNLDGVAEALGLFGIIIFAIAAILALLLFIMPFIYWAYLARIANETTRTAEWTRHISKQLDHLIDQKPTLKTTPSNLDPLELDDLKKDQFTKQNPNLFSSPESP